MYINLHAHSEWSTLDGVGTCEQRAERAAEMGQPALAITDHGTMAGALHHLRACQDAGVLPIMGVEAYFVDDRTVEDKSRGREQNTHLTLLAKNLRGWRNLMAMTSDAWRTGYYYDARVDWDLLKKYREGVIVLSGCLGSMLSQLILHGGEADLYVKRMSALFGDDFYLEIQPHDLDDQRKVNIEKTNLAMRHSRPLVATADSHYPSLAWSDTRPVVYCISVVTSLKQQKTKADKGEKVYVGESDTLHLLSEHEMKRAFRLYHKDLPEDVWSEAVQNTGLVVSTVKPFVVSKAPKLPKVEVDAKGTIEEWCVEGLKRIGRDADKLYIDRCNYELEVIHGKQVFDYFYIVADMCRWARSQKIRVGTSRGSAGGCLVSYLIGITGIDPIAHELSFERFLNPDRKGYPDIDVDFPADKRHLVKAYLQERWGQDKVTDVIAYQTFGARSTIQSVCKVFDIPQPIWKSLTEELDDEGDIEHVRKDARIDAFMEEHPEIWKHCQRLYGQVKARSKHAAGVLITDRPTNEYMPTERSKDGSVVSAWTDRVEFPIIDDYGFLKIDVLGIAGLTVQETACDMIEAQGFPRPELGELALVRDPAAIDPEVLRAFAEGRTLGVFQFGSKGITSLLRQIKPDRLLDLVAANALYRPGPLQGGMTKSYAARKNGLEPIDYFHPSLEPVLGPTYGVMAFQEQVMGVGTELAGYRPGEAYALLKVIAKLYRDKTGKARQQLVAQAEDFVARCAVRGVEDDVARLVWEKVVEFADYGFNRSHAAGYTVQATQDMWLKVHHPLAFYAALLSHEDDKKVPRIVKEVQAVGIPILPPDINTSGRGFSIDGGSIRYGLLAINGVGDVAATVLQEHQPFESREDLEARVPKRQCNARVKKALEAAGAFDCWGARDDWPMAECIEAEQRLIGVPLSAGSRLGERERALIRSVLDASDDETTFVGGELVAVSEITDKKGRRMAFCEVMFEAMTWNCTIFSRAFAKHRPHLQELGALLLMKGYADDRGSIVIEHIDTVADVLRAMNDEEVAA